MTESQQAVAKVAVGALLDLYARESADLAGLRYLTLEIEFKAGKPADARAWTERGCNLRRLLEGG